MKAKAKENIETWSFVVVMLAQLIEHYRACSDDRRLKSTSKPAWWRGILQWKHFAKIHPMNFRVNGTAHEIKENIAPNPMEEIPINSIQQVIHSGPISSKGSGIGNAPGTTSEVFDKNSPFHRDHLEGDLNSAVLDMLEKSESEHETKVNDDTSELGMSYLTKRRLHEEEMTRQKKAVEKAKQEEIEATVNEWVEWDCLVCNTHNR
jgi:hypothetical protein